MPASEHRDDHESVFEHRDEQEPAFFAPAPPDNVLADLLDRYAPFAPAPLCPEIHVFHARSLVEVWEAAERIAGQQLAAPFWAYPWAAGTALARVLLDHQEWLQSKRILDFGAGGGVTALAAARAGGAHVVANDIDPWALAVTRIAAERQAFTLEYLAGDLSQTARAGENYDVVLCSDLAYERRTAPKQRAFLQHARNHGARVLLADAGRPYFDASGTLLLAEFRLQVPVDLEGVSERTARVYELV